MSSFDIYCANCNSPFVLNTNIRYSDQFQIFLNPCSCIVEDLSSLIQDISEITKEEHFILSESEIDLICKDEIQLIEVKVPFSELRTSRDAFYTFSKHIPIYNAAKGPLAQDLIAKCRSTYEKFYKNPTRRNLKKVFEFLESIKKSQFKTVREEHGRCLRAAKRAQASLGFEVVSKKVPRKQRIYVNGSSDVPDNVRDKGLYRRIRERKKRSVSVWPSAYASGQVVQEYKRAGGRYWV